jgi:hypothetical protein
LLTLNELQSLIPLLLLVFPRSSQPIMATTATASPPGSLRQRNPASKKKIAVPTTDDTVLESLAKSSKQGAGYELDYKIALTVITILAFVSRFWGISHPNEVVFDEVHFGKVSRCNTRGSNRVEPLHLSEP